jgi:hypothetical protein
MISSVYAGKTVFIALQCSSLNNAAKIVARDLTWNNMLPITIRSNSTVTSYEEKDAPHDA